MSSFTTKLKRKSPETLQTEPITLSRKERLAQKRKAREAFNKMISTILISLFLGLVLGLPLGFTVGPRVGIGVTFLIPCLIFSYQYPRQALWAFLIYMPFSGTVTYWLAGGNILFQISKDAFYLPALLGLIQDCRRKRQPILVPKQLIPTATILVVLVLLTLIVVNGMNEFLPFCQDLPNEFLRDASGATVIDPQTTLPVRIPCKDGSPFLQGLLGFKILVGYIPLIFCAYYLIQDKKRLFFLGRLLLVLAIICCLLGLMQYWMLKTGRCEGTRGAVGDDLYRASLAAKCFVGGSLLYSPDYGQIRLPGTFVSPWHWSWFLIANAATTFAVAFCDSSRFWRMGGLAGMALVFINAVVCGQRAALFMVPLMFALLLVLTGQIANLKRFIPIGVLFALFVAIWVYNNPAIFQERIDSLVARWNQSSPIIFIQQQLDWAFRNTRGLLGRGLGQGTSSARVLGDISFVETFYAKLIYEIGLLGTLAFLIFVTHLTILSLKSNLSVRDPSLRGFGLAFWVMILIISYMPYWYPLDTDPMAVYYWFFAGVIFRLPIIDREEREKLAALQDGVSQGKKRRLVNNRLPT